MKFISVGRALSPLGFGLLAAACSSSTSSSSQKDTGTAPHEGGAADSGGNLDAGTHDGMAKDANDAGPAPDASTDAAFLYVDAAPPSMTKLPEAGTFLGAFVDILYADAGDATTANSEERFIQAEELIGRRWVIDNRFYNDATEFVSDRTLWDVQHQIVPLITWMPYGTLGYPGGPLVEIIQGHRDAYIKAEADKSKALGVQILMRWGHEMNGDWYPWAATFNGEGGGDGGVNDGGSLSATDGGDAGVFIPASGAAKYVLAWRHVHDIFVAEGATNVIWVWCPNATDVPTTTWNHWSEYYPGDDYVDWVGIDAYNWGTSQTPPGAWASFASLLTGSPYQQYAATKPIMLPETASTELGGNKAAWITAMHQNIETEFRDIRAVVWFDINKETDWQINSSPSALAAYKAMALDPFFNPK